MIDTSSHRKKYLVILLLFVFSIIAVMIFNGLTPQDTSKYKTTEFDQLGELNVATNKLVYDKAKQEARIGLFITNQSEDDTSDSFSSMVTTLNNNTSVLEALNNIKFSAKVVGFKHAQQPLPTEMKLVNNNYLVVTVSKVSPQEPILRLDLTPHLIYKKQNDTATSIRNNEANRFYFRMKDFQKGALLSGNNSLKTDAYQAQIKVIQKVIAQGQKENRAAQRENQEDKQLIKKIEAMLKYDSTKSAETHKAQIENYQDNIKQNKAKILSNEQQIKDLQEQIKRLKKN